jgi:enolase
MTEFEVESVRAREVLDCRLEPTLRVAVETAGGAAGRADVPAGRSRGGREAVERRDGGDRYRGRGVREAAATVEGEVASALRGRDVRDQRGLDRALIDLDGTPDKSRLGGNVTTGASLAALRAGAAATGRPLYRHLGGIDGPRLPMPLFDLIEGGELAATALPFQEHQLVPVGAASLAEAVRIAAETYYELGDLLAADYDESARNVGVEGGYTPAGMTDARAAFDSILAAAAAAGHAGDVALGLDAAATHLYDDGRYDLGDRRLDRAGLLSYYESLAADYPLVSVEDPLAEDDFRGFAALRERIGAQVVGDDLLVTDADRVARAAGGGDGRGQPQSQTRSQGDGDSDATPHADASPDTGGPGRAADALLVKVNQVGTVTEALAAVDAARTAGMRLQVSERSGQTPDTWLAEFAVGVGAGQVKTGVTRGERTEQYNRLLELEADGVPFAGWDA